MTNYSSPLASTNTLTDSLNSTASDEYWMELAINYAKESLKIAEVPVGAVIVQNNTQLVSYGFNERETSFDPTSHAELLAIRRAAANLQRWRLHDCTLYVTLEPCIMCAGAIILARIPRVVFGTRDKKAGAVVSIYNILQDPRLNHRPEISEGVFASVCQELLRSFFLEKRKKK